MAKDTQSRKWQLTINNPADKGFDHDKLRQLLGSMKSVIYWCMADEIGGKRQILGWLVFNYHLPHNEYG